nr:MAG TPA: Late nodulin protein [Caudoviricetes sp.]
MHEVLKCVYLLLIFSSIFNKYVIILIEEVI